MSGSPAAAGIASGLLLVDVWSAVKLGGVGRANDANAGSWASQMKQRRAC